MSMKRIGYTMTNVDTEIHKYDIIFKRQEYKGKSFFNFKMRCLSCVQDEVSNTPEDIWCIGNWKTQRKFYNDYLKNSKTGIQENSRTKIHVNGKDNKTKFDKNKPNGDYNKNKIDETMLLKQKLM